MMVSSSRGLRDPDSNACTLDRARVGCQAKSGRRWTGVDSGLATGRRVSYHRPMAAPIRKPPAGNEHFDEAIDILRRLEPVLSKLDERTQRIESEQKEQRKDIAKLQQDAARIDGRLIELSTRVPAIWTIAALIFAIFGASFVLIRFASGH